MYSGAFAGAVATCPRAQPSLSSGPIEERHVSTPAPALLWDDQRRLLLPVFVELVMPLGGINPLFLCLVLMGALCVIC
jgi:hypothetical protein